VHHFKRFTVFLLLLAAIVSPGCDDLDTPIETPPAANTLGPGEVCGGCVGVKPSCVPDAPEPEFVKLRFMPAELAVAPGQTRKTRLVVDPDFCTPTPVTFESSDAAVVAAPEEGTVDYGSPAIDLEITGGALGADQLPGSATITARVGEATVQLTVHVLDDSVPSCEVSDDVAPTQLAVGQSVSAQGSLAGAWMAIPERADQPAAKSVTWTVSEFDLSIACAANIVPDGYIAMGPSVTFGDADDANRTFRRDLPMSVPINPVLLPEAARWRHLRMAYSGPAFKEPRTIPLTDPRVVRDDDGVWQLHFKAPRLGTYQAVVHNEAGSRTRSRRITHRALVGVSMGGIGASAFGLRHHHLFDVIAGMGGPVDWTWLMDHFEKNHLSGFRPIAPGTVLQDIQIDKTLCTETDTTACQSDESCVNGRCTIMPATDEPYEHATNFNNWWYEPNEIGNGGDFSREDYVQILRDLALVFGNPFSYNPLQHNLPAGVDPMHPSVLGDTSKPGRTEGACATYVKPIDGDDEDAQNVLWNECPRERCQFTQVLSNYYDDLYNPDGTFPVITFCDGSPRDGLPGYNAEPYASSWQPEGNNHPAEVVLAVDYNGNGVRDELEPVIYSGHESWDDWGEDQTPSTIEPGYGPDNLDPSGDDYNPQYNPTGTEGDHRWQEGEPYLDYGLDGVANTVDSPYDHGEGDGEFTAAAGLQRFWDYDPHSLVRGWSNLEVTPLDDDALARIDFWTDGGIRDLFNFVAPARHLLGTFAARGRNAVTFGQFNQMPGLDPDNVEEFNPAHIVWEDVQGVVMQRYGIEEPTANQLEQGTGMHVGTINEIATRLQAALYFTAARWPDAPRTQSPSTPEKPAEDRPACEYIGNCTFDFTSSFGRIGQVGVTLPPGYAHADLQEARYPVIYVMHGYGQVPEDLQLAIAFLPNWMNGNTDSQASRLGKAILVYLDGRCRWQNGKEAECIRGNFYVDSINEDGPQIDSWMLELMDHIDQTYRTMGETTISWDD
jgi:hypothetical protein